MKRTSLWLVFSVSLFVLMLAPHVIGSGHPGTNYLTFNRPVRLPGVVLGAGTYIFEKADPWTPEVVRVLSGDRRTAYFMGFTLPADRPQGLDPGAVVSLGESRPGSAAPVTIWWPIGESRGHAFMYR